MILRSKSDSLLFARFEVSRPISHDIIKADT